MLFGAILTFDLRGLDVRYMLARLSLAALFVILAVSTSQAAKRIGLVIGNDNYEHVPVLEKARSDARAIGRALSGVSSPRESRISIKPG